MGHVWSTPRFQHQCAYCYAADGALNEMERGVLALGVLFWGGRLWLHYSCDLSAAHGAAGDARPDSVRLVVAIIWRGGHGLDAGGKCAPRLCGQPPCLDRK